MYKVFLILLIICPILLAEETETLLGNDIEHGGYGGPIIKISPIRGKIGVLTGAKAGWIIDHRFVLGIAGYGLTTQNIEADEKTESGKPKYVQMGYGGFDFEYIFKPYKLIHLSGNALIGGGGIGYSLKRCDYQDNEEFEMEEEKLEYDALFVFEPGINVELNIVSFMRIQVGGSYRFIGGIDSSNLKNSDFSSPNFNILFKFGSF